MGYLLRHFLHFFSCYTLQKNSEKRLRAPFWQQARQSNYRGQQKAYSCTRGPNKSASIISITVFFCMSFVITASPNTQSKWLTFCNRELQNAEILSRCFFFFLGKNVFFSKSRSSVCENVCFSRTWKLICRKDISLHSFYEIRCLASRELHPGYKWCQTLGWDYPLTADTDWVTQTEILKQEGLYVACKPLARKSSNKTFLLLKRNTKILWNFKEKQDGFLLYSTHHPREGAL